MLPAAVRERLRAHLAEVKPQHERDLVAGVGRAVLPFALDRKYPAASTEWTWQFVFPAARICRDRRWGPSVEVPPARVGGAESDGRRGAGGGHHEAPRPALDIRLPRISLKRAYARNQDARVRQQPEPTAREPLPKRTLPRRRLDTRRRSRATITRRVSKAGLQPVTRANIRAVRQLRCWPSRPRAMVRDSKTDSGLLHELLGRRRRRT
jgi:hypothetical protein